MESSSFDFCCPFRTTTLAFRSFGQFSNTLIVIMIRLETENILHTVDSLGRQQDNIYIQQEHGFTAK